MRLFIAINFDKQTKEHIIKVQNRLKSHSNGSFSHSHNLHLTLAFLGEINQTDIPKIKSAMDSIHIPKFNLIFNHTGYFKRNDGSIWWIGLENNNDLLILQKELTDTLINYGFNLEKREYKPHITLARRVKAYSKIDKHILIDPAFSTQIDSISLMLSERADGRLRYSELYAVYAE